MARSQQEPLKKSARRHFVLHPLCAPNQLGKACQIVVIKSNTQQRGTVMGDEIAPERAPEFPDVTWDKVLVDAMTVRMAQQKEC